MAREPEHSLKHWKYNAFMIFLVLVCLYSIYWTAMEHDRIDHAPTLPTHDFALEFPR